MIVQMQWVEYKEKDRDIPYEAMMCVIQGLVVYRVLQMRTRENILEIGICAPTWSYWKNVKVVQHDTKTT